jgi:hypothetical protein
MNTEADVVVIGSGVCGLRWSSLFCITVMQHSKTGQHFT